jgi:hypothetical protein
VKPSLRIIPITQLVLNDKNADKGTSRGREFLEEFLEKYGAGRSGATNGKPTYFADFAAGDGLRRFRYNLSFLSSQPDQRL